MALGIAFLRRLPEERCRLFIGLVLAQRAGQLEGKAQPVRMGRNCLPAG